jgi:hypothetical protein
LRELTALRVLGSSVNRHRSAGMSYFKAMFRRLITSVQEARGTQLKRQFENASLYIRDLGNEQAERFSRGLTFVQRLDRTVRTGEGGSHPATDDQKNEERRARTLRAQHRCGLRARILSHHIEASYLRGADAAFVYDLTAHYISQAGDAARRMVGEPREESESGSSGF